jgi:transporter family protein
MERWVIYAFLSMFFAGFTAVIAKQGMVGISSELGLTVRTIFVFVFVVIFALYAVTPSEFVATALSWVFYYKALKLGDVATVALIDKGSVLVAIFLAWLILKEAITPRIVIGAGMVFLGLLIIAKRN